MPGEAGVGRVSPDLGFSCSCSTVRGLLRQCGPRTGDRYVCHCHDCRDIVRLFGREKDMLERGGGVSLYQTRIGLFSLTAGPGALACIHLTDKPLLRWYASCCGTPLFHTVHSGRWPFVTMLDRTCDPASREALLGPPKGHVFAESATEPLGEVPNASFFRVMRRFAQRMVRDYLTGDYRRSPLFDPTTFAPLATPRRLTDQERRTLGRPH